MEREVIRPCEIIAEFVNIYERKLAKAIRNRNLNVSITSAIMALQLHEEIVKQHPLTPLEVKREVFKKYTAALGNLQDLIGAVNSKKVYNEIVALAERNIADIDLMLNNDANYQRFRQEATE